MQPVCDHIALVSEQGVNLSVEKASLVAMTPDYYT